MSRHSHHRRLIAAAATVAALTVAAPTASARPIDSDFYQAPQPARVTVVRAPAEQGLNWRDAGLGAAGMLALVLVGVGGAQALGAGPGHRRPSAHS